MASSFSRRACAQRRSNRLRDLKRFRRVVFEQLECRLPLDGGLTSAAISSAQRQALLDGLTGFSAWTDVLGNSSKLAQQISLVDTSIGQELDVGSLLQKQLIGPLAAAPAATTDSLVNLLKGLSTTAGGLVITVDPTMVSGGLLSAAQGNELQFNLIFDATKTRPVGLDLGANVLNAGLHLDSATVVPLSSSLHLAFTFGLDLRPGLNAGEAFFVRVNTLGESVAVHTSNLSASGQVGFLDTPIQGASLDLSAATSIGLVNPDADAPGNITLTELQSTNIAALTTISAASNSLTANFPVSASLGTYTFGGAPALSLSATDVFAAPAPAVMTNAGYDELAFFNNLNASSLLTVLDRVASGLTAIGPTLDVNVGQGGIPYVDKQVSQVVDFNALLSRVSRGLYDPVVTAAEPFSLAVGGRLTGDALFSVLINDTETDALWFHSAAQQVNETLVQFLNRTMPPALAGRVVFSSSGTVLSLRAIDPAITKLQMLISDRRNPITYDMGFEPGQLTSPVFKFSSVQTFVPVLAQLMGVSPASVNPLYDAATHAVSFQVNLQGAPSSQTVPLDFSNGFGPLTVLSGQTATFTATPTVTGSVGVELAGLQTVLTASADAPASGILTATAHFTVTLNSASPLTVAVAPDATNANVGDLVADLNAALALVGLGRQVTATSSGNRLALSAPTGSTLHVDAAAGDSATTFLHLAGDGAPPAWSQHVFLGAGTQVNVASQISAANISGPAALGILPVTVSGATTTITLGSAVTVAARTHIQDLSAHPAAAVSVPAATATLAGHALVPVDATYGVNSSTPAAFDLGLAAPNRLATVLTATAPAPSQLTAAAHFTLAVGSAAPVAVTVAADATNQSLDDLVADINQALQATNLRALVVAGKSGNLITLSTSGFYALTLSSASGDSTQTDLHLASGVAGPAITFVANSPFNDKLAPLQTFGTAQFVTSVQGILDLFQKNELNALTSQVPLLNQSVDDVLGMTSKLKTIVQTLQSQTGISLKLAIQGTLANLKAAIAGLPNTLPAGSTDALFQLFDSLTEAANNAERTDLPVLVNLASSVVASLAPLTTSIGQLQALGANVTALNTVLTSLKNSTGTLPDLPTRLATLLGSNSSVQSLFGPANSNGSDQALILHVAWQPNTTRAMSLGSLKLPNGLGPLKFAAGSTINLTLTSDLKLDFGYDLATGAPFLLDTSRFNASALLGSPNTTYAATIGGTAVTLGNTSSPVALRLATATNSPPATLAILVKPTALGSIPFANVQPTSLNYAGVSGHLGATLPVYFLGNNQGNVTVDWDFPQQTAAVAPTVTAPANLIPALQSVPYDFAVFEDGISQFNAVLAQTLQTDALGKLPLVQGGLDLDGGFVGTLKTQFLNAVTTAINNRGGVDSTQLRQDLSTAVQTVFGSKLVGTPQVSTSGSPEINFEIHGTDTYHAGLRLGLLGLGLDTFPSGGDVAVTVNYDLKLGYGISKTEGFYFNIQPVAAGAAQFTFTVNAALSPGSVITGNLLSLPVTMQTNVDALGKSLTQLSSAELDFKLLDPDHHLTTDQLDAGKLDPADLAINFGSAGAAVHVDLQVVANTNVATGDATLPGLMTDLRVDQHFGAGVKLDDPAAVPQVELHDIRVPLGAALVKIVKPILDKVNTFLAPIRPVLIALDQDVPVLSRIAGHRITWLDAIRLYDDEPDAQKNIDNAKEAISILRALSDLVAKADTLASSLGVVHFGDYHFNALPDLRLASAGPLNPLTSGTLTGGFAKSVNDAISPDVRNADPTTGAYLGDDLYNDGVRFPIFEDPQSAVGLLFGQNVTLVTWDLPTFGAAFTDETYLGTVLVGPVPVNIELRIHFGVKFNVGLGFDTRGLQPDHTFLEGFFFEDQGHDGPPVIDFSAGVGVSGSVGIPYVAEAGVEGRATADILAHWKDDDHDGKVYLDELLTNLDQGPECVFDLTGELSLQMFFFLDVFLGPSITIPVVPSITLFSFDNDCPPLPPPELAHFSDGNDLDYLGQKIPSGTLVLNIGPFAGQRQPGISKDGDERMHVYENQPGVFTVTGFGQSKDYGDAQHPVSAIYGDAGIGKNVVLVDSTVIVPTTLVGGPDDDQLQGGSAPNHIVGRGGKDLLVGGIANDFIEAGSGNASLYGGPGNDQLVAIAGNNYFDGDDGNDVIVGGTGSDQIFGGDGDDQIYGGGGSDQIFGGKGNDTIAGQGNSGDYIEGGPGDNIIIGSDGPDVIYADRAAAPLLEAGRNQVFGLGGDDVINGGIDNFNELHGGTGNDIINAGSFGDWLFGDADGDVINGGAGNDIIHAGSGTDLVYGNAGNDLIFADSGNNTIYGGIGSDTIFGSTGSGAVRPVNWPPTLPFGFNTDFAGPGSDTIYGEAGIDFIYGGVGTATIDGGTFNDFIYGGSGTEVLHGGSGDDFLQTGDGDEQLFGDTGDDLLVQTVGANQALTDTTLTGRGSDTQDGFERAQLVDSSAAGGFSFAVGGWTAAATLVGSIAGNDRVSATADADMTLADGNLKTSLGGSFLLTNIRQANLTGISLDNVFDVSLWTGTGLLTGGSGLDRVVTVNDANLILSDTSLSRSSGGSFTLSGIKRATLGGGPGNNLLDAHAFSGDVLLYGAAGNDTLLGGSGNDYLDAGTGIDGLDGGAGDDVLVAMSSASAMLTGGSGDDLVYASAGADTIDAGAGRDRVYAGGGDDVISGGPGDDTLDGGAGNDTISGDADADLITGGAGNDILYAFNSSGTGDDGAINYLYGDYGTAGNEAGSGNDALHGGTGNDQLFGEAGTNTIDGGGSGALKNDGVGVGNPSPIPPPPIPVPTNWPPALSGTTASFPIGTDSRGRWTELAGSATDGGLSNSPAAAIDPSIAVGIPGQYVAWADSRTGTSQIYVSLHTALGWQELAGSAHGGGISSAVSAAVRPSIALDTNGLPIVAWTQTIGATTDIYVARYDPLANAGQGGWVALGTSLSGGGISGTGKSDQARVVITSAGPVVAWLNSAAGVTNVYVRQFQNGAWVALTTGSASGSGISASATSVSEMTLATDGTKVAVAWSADVGGRTQIYLKEINGTAFNPLGTSTSGNGLSGSAGRASAASLAYLGGTLFAAWQDDTSGHSEVYAAKFDGNNWVAAGAGANSGSGVSSTHGAATHPQLAASGNRLYVMWLDDRLANFTGNATAMYVKRWDGSAFQEELIGDASYRGIADAVGAPRTPALALDSASHPFAVWADTVSGKSEIYVRGNAFDIGTVHYVNDSDAGLGDTLANAFATAAGSDNNDGLSPAKPKRSLQAILDDNAHHLSAGDVILVDSGTYPDSVVLTSAGNGVLVRGAPGEPAVQTGLINVVNAANVTLDHLTLASGVAATGGSNLTIVDNAIQGLGVTLSGGSSPQVIHNIVTPGGSGVTLAGGVQNPVVEHNLIRARYADVRLAGTGGAGLEIRANRLRGDYGDSQGISLSVPGSGHIGGNRIDAAGTGLALSAVFSGLIENNDISQAAWGVQYVVGELLSNNRIHDNGTGIVTMVGSTATGVGYLATTLANQIYKNNLGVQLQQAVLQGQHVFANGTGVAGIGSLTPSDLAHANLIETNTVGVDIDGPIQFNRIARNGVGIQAHSSQLIAHNDIYQNAVGVNVQGQSDVRLFQNTIYAPAGDGIKIGAASQQVEVRGNILWTGSGYDIFVANDSTSGFFSDYNDLHASGAGKLIYWTRDFSDILDWQEDVHQFDLHSIGRTVVNPVWSQPRFVSLSLDDFRVFDETARQRFSSPTIDLGDPRSDQGLPASFQNLLVNAGFESGLAGWTALPSGATQTANPHPWSGSSYFFAGPSPVTTLDQTVDLIAAGVNTAAIDSQNLSLVFGGRVRSASEAIPDSATLTVTFFDANQVVLGEDVVTATNVSDRWELVGDRLSIPSGARTARYRLTAVEHTGNTNDVYLDGAFVYIQPDTVAPNLGADGNTFTEAAQNVNQHLVQRTPDLYTDWLRDAPLKIRWDSFGNTTAAPVRIDLYQDGPNGPALVKNIATAVPDNGQFTWIAANSNISYGTYGLRIRISIVGNETISARSTETFTVPEDPLTHTYYVNDGSAANDEYTSAIGSNRNTGRLANAPKPYPNNILRIYALGPNDTLFVDNGDFPELYPTVISPLAGINDDHGFALTGPTSANRAATFHPANPLSQAPVLELNDADFLTINHLTLASGTIGLWVHAGSTNLTAGFLNIHDNYQEGIRVESNSTVLDLGNSTLVHNGFGAVINHQTGLYIDGPLGRLHHTSVTFSGDKGIWLNNPGPARIEANVAAHNGGFGLMIGNFGLPTAVVGNADLSLGLGNLIDDNVTIGLLASDEVQVFGNTVSNTHGAFSYGIQATTTYSSLTGVEVGFNVVHDNVYGIFGGKLVHNNRVYHNAATGIYLPYFVSNAAVTQNVVYSNNIGIETINSVVNNLIYANTTAGIEVHPSFFDGFVPQLLSNTIYQPTGDAVQVDFHTPNVVLRDNILWTQSGYDMSVDSTSQPGFTSDYNILTTTATGKVALWQGVGRPTLAAWQNTTFQDAHSIAQDPLFVNPLGADGKLGFFSTASDGRDDDFHEQSLQGSVHGGSLAPVVGPAGLPIAAPGALAVDSKESAAIDRGAPGDSFANEPTPNGNFINLGAYGNTSQASLSPAAYVLVTSPDGGETWPQGHMFDITWRSQNSSSTVKIELLQKSNGGGPPQSILTIATAAPNNGVFSWAIPTTVSPAANYLIGVTRNDNAALTDTSNANFAIAPPINVYYVNDGAVAAGDWTTAAGDNANDGLTPATPKAAIGAVLAAYHLNPGDLIRVDSGTYNVGVNIVLGAAVSGVTIEGYHEAAFPSRRAVLDRGNTSNGSAAFEIHDAVNTTLKDLTITGGESGVLGPSGLASSGLTIADSTIFGNSVYGIRLLAGHDHVTVAGNQVFGIAGGPPQDDQYQGIQVDGAEATITQNTVYDSTGSGIQSSGAHVLVSKNEVYDTGTAITVLYGGLYDPADRATISGNIVHDNTAGIYAGGSVLVAGNTVYGQNNSFETGINGGGEIQNNTVYDNSIGIQGFGLIHDNQVYHNLQAGIVGYSGATIYANTSYSNLYGIESSGESANNSTQYIHNNLVYANTGQGIYLHGYHNDSNNEVFNNTVYQPLGDAIHLESNSTNVHLRDNILWVQSGFDISMDSSSEFGFQSDNNDLYTTASGHVGQWEGRNFDRLIDWSYELSLDAHSISADPKFANPAGADGALGFDASAWQSPAQIFGDSFAGLAVSGDWDRVDQSLGTGGGFLESVPAASVSKSATWTIAGLQPPQTGQTNTYPVTALWHANRGLDSASYSYTSHVQIESVNGLGEHSIHNLDGGGSWGSKNQRDSNGAFLGDISVTIPANFNGEPIVSVSGVTITVTVSGGQNIIADAVNLGGFANVTLDAPVVSGVGDWVSGGLQGNYYRRASGGRDDAATWTITGLTPGAIYEVSSTWLNYNTLAPSYNLLSGARYFLYDGAPVVGATGTADTLRRAVTVDQTVAATDFQDAGVGWKRLALIQVSGTTLTVKLSAQADAAIIADAIRVQQVHGNTGIDDDFHLNIGSPAIDRGNLADYSYAEPAPSGDRVDLGAYGNTPQSAASPNQLVQVLSPAGREKLQPGQQYTINWRSAGLTPERTVALVDAGSTTASDNFGADVFQTSYQAFSSVTHAIDTSGVADVLPQSVYQTYTKGLSFGSDQGNVSYQLAVPDGTYTLKLQFVEPFSIAGQRPFNIDLQGTTALANYDIAADAGTTFKATEKTFTVTASGGSGISLHLVSTSGNVYSYPAIISAIEVAAANLAGVAAPTFNLELSADAGATWSPLASNQPVDRFGRGSFLWTVPVNLPPGNQYLVRVTANDGVHPQGVSDNTFQIAAAGHDYYINDNSTGGDIFTTAVGDNANNGKSPSAPMASLSALLAAYQPHAGDVVHVDTGNYALLQNIVLTAQNSGLRIEGPSTAIALLDRNNQASTSYGFELNHATNVTLDHLQITRAYNGVNAANDSHSTGLVISNSTIFGNDINGVYLGISNDGANLTGNTFYGFPGTVYFSQSTGINIASANDVTITSSRLYNASNSISGSGQRVTISGNEIYASYYGLQFGGSGTISNNVVHDNGGVGISVNSSFSVGPLVVSGNTVYGHPNPQQTGISATGAEVRGNTVFDNYDGISGDSVIANRVYHNSHAGIVAIGAVQGNTVYSNAIGLLLAYGFTVLPAGSYRALNNLVYGNTIAGMDLVAGATGYQIVNNTVYQPTGDAIRFEGDTDGAGAKTTNTVIRNNLLWAQAGYDLVVPASAEGGLRSDYNNLFTTTAGKLGNWQAHDFTDVTTWFYETGQDQHSLIASPQFVSPAGADGILGYDAINHIDRGRDDDFHVLPGSAMIDRGDPADAYFQEPTPNGNRIEIGGYGNTLGATPSAPQLVQVVAPSPNDKLQVGQQVTISWHSAGLTPQRPVALLNAGGATADNWVGDRAASGVFFGTFANPVDTSAVTNPAPQAVYQSYAQAPLGVGKYDNLTYQFPVPDGNYTIRLHFVESYQFAYVGQRKFDIQLQGNTVQAAYDIFADVGALKATAKTYVVTASGGSGIALSLATLASSAPAIISGIEIQADDPFGFAAPTFNLELSGNNGATWSPLASNLLADRFGRGSYVWTIPANQPLGSQYVLRATSNDGLHAQGVSSGPFLITNNGHEYYINDNSQTGDVLTTTVGNNANSGKGPDQPMANLAALVAAYSLGAGDTVHVDTGTYSLLRTVVLTAQHSGVRIAGPLAATALFQRGITGPSGGFLPNISSVFELRAAANVTLDHLSMTNAYTGIFADDNAGATGLTVSNSSIFGVNDYGINVGKANDRLAVMGSTFYGLPGGSSTDNQIYGIYYLGSDGRITGNKIYDSGDTGLSVGFNSARTLISGNDVYGQRNGINVGTYGGSPPETFSMVTGNIVHDNTVNGITAQGAVVSGNTVYGQSTSNATGISGGADVFSNTVYGNYNGIAGATSTRLNSVFNNSNIGISANGTVLANKVYSNSVGIVFNTVNYTLTSPIANNIIYANRNTGLLLNVYSYDRLDVVNNTIYQSVGDAISVQGSTQNIKLKNNLLWVEAGYDINVASGAQGGVASDYNLLYHGPDSNAHVGFWNNANQDTLAAWQTASSQDAHSLATQPQFVDRDGADNVLGYAPVNGTNVNGGADDNFYLKAGSPGIDVGFSWSYATDAEGFSRRDAASTTNQGSIDYFATPLTQSLFAATGQKLSLNPPLTGYTLPFSFPFYDSSQSFIYISPQGYLRVGNDFVATSGDNASLFANNRMIAPLMDGNLAIDLARDPSDYLYADTSVANQVTFRWNVTNELDHSDVQFAAILFSDGRIRFDYGPGNTNLHSLIGLSYGRQRASQIVTGYSGAPNLTNANSLSFPQSPGYIDLGAYEFRGSGSDLAAPTITSTLPAAVAAAGNTGGRVNSIKLLFSEDVNPIDANAPAVFELRKAGSHGFGSADDVIYQLTPSYVAGSDVVTLSIGGLAGAGLSLGQYRLTATSNTNTSIHDLAGLRLDGDANGSEGGDYVRIFSIVAPTNDVSLTQLVDSATPFESSTIHYTLSVSNITGGQATSIQVGEALPSGVMYVSSATSSGAFDPVAGVWTIPALAPNGSASLTITAFVQANTAPQTLTATATMLFVDQGDSNSANNTGLATITVQSASSNQNHAPTFDHLAGNYSAADEDPVTKGPALQQVVTGWATNISAGPASETGQFLNFIVTNDNPGLFKVAPQVGLDGKLTYTPLPNMHGTANITVKLHDDGGGTDTSDSVSFQITITKTHRLHNAAEAGSRNGRDVSGSTSPQPDGFIVAGDVLTVINYINANGSGSIATSTKTAPPYPDVDGDDNVVAEDVIDIINWINAHPRQSEGEADQLAAPADAESVGVALMSPTGLPNAAHKPDTSAVTAAVAPTSISVDLMNLLAADAATARLKRRHSLS
jgi:hypothetical protein